MKSLFCILCLTGLFITAHAQLNTDSSRNTARITRATVLSPREQKLQDFLHPRVRNLANPETSYEIDGTVYSREAIINRHVTNINDLVR